MVNSNYKNFLNKIRKKINEISILNKSTVQKCKPNNVFSVIIEWNSYNRSCLRNVRGYFLSFRWRKFFNVKTENYKEVFLHLFYDENKNAVVKLCTFNIKPIYKGDVRDRKMLSQNILSVTTVIFFDLL